MPMQMSSGPTPSSTNIDVKLMEYERKMQSMMAKGVDHDDPQFKKLKEQFKTNKTKTTENTNLLKELEMKMNSMTKSMPNFDS